MGIKRVKNRGDIYSSIDALNLVGDLVEPLDDCVGVDIAESGVILGLTLRLCHQMLPGGVAGKQVPLLSPIFKIINYLVNPRDKKFEKNILLN